MSLQILYVVYRKREVIPFKLFVSQDAKQIGESDAIVFYEINYF